MATTLCTSGATVLKAGTNAATLPTDADYTSIINQAEGVICAVSRYNWIDNYAALNADVKYILEEIASNLSAIYVITYDMSGFTTRIEAEDMINVLRDGALRGLSIIRDQKVKDFINGA